MKNYRRNVRYIKSTVIQYNLYFSQKWNLMIFGSNAFFSSNQIFMIDPVKFDYENFWALFPKIFILPELVKLTENLINNFKNIFIRTVFHFLRNSLLIFHLFPDGQIVVDKGGFSTPLIKTFWANAFFDINKILKILKNFAMVKLFRLY